MRVMVQNAPWMVWNILLALVPLGLAWRLFSRGHRRLSPWWWAGAAAFVAFLPNAPYVMTDVIHVRSDVAAVRGRDGAVTVVFVQYGAFVLIGVAAYVASLELLRRFLRQRGLSPRAVAVVQIALHGACAIGVLLGRFARFNSWDLVTRPTTVLEHLGVRVFDAGSWRLALITFGVLVTITQLSLMSGRIAHVASTRLVRVRRQR